MNKKEIQEKLDGLNNQLKQVEATYLKIQGAIELCNNLLEEPKEESKKEEKK